jgi:predicted Fe-Mo cluster-binding NifX family protein
VRVSITASGPTLESDVDPRFGRARFLLVLEDHGEIAEAIENRAAGDLPHGAGIAAVEALVRRGVTLVLTGQVGPKASEGLRAAGIELRTGAAGSCRQALAALAPELRPLVAPVPS